MIRTWCIIMFISLSGRLAKNYLIEVGDKAGEKGDGVEEGGGDYSQALNIEMKEYGQFNIIVFFKFDIKDVPKFQGRNRRRGRRRGRGTLNHKKYVGDSIMLCCEVAHVIHTSQCC